MKPRRLLAALCLLAAAPLAETAETWREVRARDVVLVSNLDEERARGLLADLLAFRHVLSRALPDADVVASVPTQIYAFRDAASFSPFLPQEEGSVRTSGYFRRGPVKNVIAIDASGAVSGTRTLFHEYVHLVASGQGEALPFWFEEGLSELYATTRIQEGGAEIGAADARHLRRLLKGDLLPLGVLLRARREDAVATEPLFYAQSWLLVHYYVVGGRGGGREALARALARMGRGTDPLEALDEVPDLVAYARRPSPTFATLRVDVPRAPDAAFEVTELSRGRVQHRWGELFLYLGRLSEARVCLDEAREREPELGAVRETLGLAALHEGDYDTARAHLRAAMDLGGATPSGLYLYARAVLREYSGHFVASIPEPVAREAERALRSSLRIKPAQSETARLLAFVYLVRGRRLREAEALVRGALLLEPRDPSLRYLEGQLLARRGEYDRAREVLDAVIRDAEEPELRAAASAFLAQMSLVERAPGS